jgi:hypothetical protein
VSGNWYFESITFEIGFIRKTKFVENNYLPK